MAESLLAGAALGAAFGELLKAVLKTTNNVVEFQAAFANLKAILSSIAPYICEMEKQNTDLGRPIKELESLVKVMKKGKKLVLKCSNIHWLDFLGKAHYKKKLDALVDSLEKFFAIDLQIQMARDLKEALLHVRKMENTINKIPRVQAKEYLTGSSSHSTTVLGEEVNGSETQTIEEDQVLLKLSGCYLGMENSSTNPLNVSYSMTALENAFESLTSGIEANGNENAVTQKKKGVLSVTVISAEDLPALDFRTKSSDPYAVLTLMEAEAEAKANYKTMVVKKNLYPVWNQTFDFVVDDGLHDIVIVEVWDHDTIGKDDYMGKCILKLTRVILEGEYKERYKLDGAKSGYLNLHLKWMPLY